MAHQVEIELESLEVHGEDRRQLSDAGAHQRIALGLALATKVLVVTGQHLTFDIQLERLHEILLVLDLDADRIERLVAFRVMSAALGDELSRAGATKQLPKQWRLWNNAINHAINRSSDSQVDHANPCAEQVPEEFPSNAHRAYQRAY